LQWLVYKGRFDLGTSEMTLTQAAEAAAIMPGKTFDPKDRFPDARDILEFASSLISIEEIGDPIDDCETDESEERELAIATTNNIDSTENTAGILLTRFADDGQDVMDIDTDLSDEIRKADVPAASDTATLKSPTVRLAHASVREYLESALIRTPALSMFQLSEEKAQLHITEACLRYLLYFDQSITNIEKDVSWQENWPLLSYAATNWAHHLSRVASDPYRCRELCTLALPILDPKRRCHKVWKFAIDPDICDHGQPLTFAIEEGCPLLARVLIESGYDVLRERSILNSKMRYGSLRGIAIKANDDELLKLLMDQGVNVKESENYEPYTPLAVAMWSKNLEAVKTLIEAGVQIRLSFLDRLIELGAHEKIDRATVMSGLGDDLAIRDRTHFKETAFYRGPILPLVHELGYREAEESLKKAGHSINGYFENSRIRKPAFSGTLLSPKMVRGDVQQVDSLLQDGANPDVDYTMPMQDLGYSSIKARPLHAAILVGKVGLVERLLAASADPNALCELHRMDSPAVSVSLTPLGLCPLFNSDIKILEALVAERADVNHTANEEVMPALIGSIIRFRLQAADLLLERGANVHYDGRFGTPLYHAAHLFDKRLERRMREAGAMDVTTVPYWTGF
jgi:ankyrin repeat protein